jgi:hypothetical protein
MELFSINSKKGALNSQPQVIKLAHGQWFSPSTPAFNSYTGEDSVRVVLTIDMTVTFNLTNTNTQSYKMLFNETSRSKNIWHI